MQRGFTNIFEMNLPVSINHRSLIRHLTKHLHFIRNSRQGTTKAFSTAFHKPKTVFENREAIICVKSRTDVKRDLNTRYLLNFCNGGAHNQSYIHTSPACLHGEYEWQDPKSEEEIVNVNFKDKEGRLVSIKGKVGDNLLYLAKRFEVEMEGACEASLACTTCHVYVDHDYLDRLPEATETEEDLLDQAPFLKENSRLGCQIILNKELEGIKLTLPAVTKNFYVDGHKPTPH